MGVVHSRLGRAADLSCSLSTLWKAGNLETQNPFCMCWLQFLLPLPICLWFGICRSTTAVHLINWHTLGGPSLLRFYNCCCSIRQEPKSSKLSHRDFPCTLVSSSEQESRADFLFLLTLTSLYCCSPSANWCLWWIHVFCTDSLISSSS